MLEHDDYQTAFAVHTDAPYSGLGATLCQQQDAKEKADAIVC